MRFWLKNMNGESSGRVDLRDDVFDVPLKPSLIHQVVVGQLANARQGTVKTQTRAEVSGGGRKPRPQKGTGNARQGSLSAPQFKGGGVVFGPKPKFKQHVRINRKERKKVIKYLFIDLHRKKQLDC